MRIVTDSRRPEEPKDPEADNVFAIYRYFAGREDIERIRQRYLAGGLAYSEIKEELFGLLESRFGEARSKFEAFMQDWGYLDQVLLIGAEKARRMAVPMMDKIRRAVGVD
jgi:tryptophanyl-tRNA synthetase